jgi:hypothetical protein
MAISLILRHGWRPKGTQKHVRNAHVVPVLYSFGQRREGRNTMVRSRPGTCPLLRFSRTAFDCLHQVLRFNFSRTGYWRPTGRKVEKECWLTDGTGGSQLGHNSSLLSPTVNLNCHPSKLINIRPNSSQATSRPSIMRSGTRASWASSHSITPRTTRWSAICNPS